MKKKTTRRQVLLSFLGTTDPIRGERDGAMLHILRHYRPEVVCLLFTPEVRKLAEADERYEKVFFHLKSHWDGYAPVVLEQDLSVSDVSDMDELDQPLHVVMNRLSREYADAEILVNIPVIAAGGIADGAGAALSCPGHTGENAGEEGRHHRSHQRQRKLRHRPGDRVQ